MDHRVDLDPLSAVTAVVVTHMRPQLAGQLVRILMDTERLTGEQIVVVVNEVGGLDDPLLESAVRMVHLDDNLGPAGGFKAGMQEAFSDPATKWAYLCEDDVGLLPIDLPRLPDLIRRIDSFSGTQKGAGAVVAYGRIFERRTGHSVNLVPAPDDSDEFVEVDVAAWGATLVSRAVFEAGVVPDPELFFGYEDFDYFCKVREAGFSVLLDPASARKVADYETTQGRIQLHSGRRPSDADESWRAYYVARNFFTLARRHGSRSWLLAHLAYSVRRAQLSTSRQAKMATLRGVIDGARGRLGRNPRYLRSAGEIVMSPNEPEPVAELRAPVEPGSP
jgi:GT2 family glycosyltransferase